MSLYGKNKGIYSIPPGRGGIYTLFPSAVVPIPPFSSVSLCAGLFNGNPDDYTGGLAINLGDNEDNYNFSVRAPYPPNWASIAGAGGTNPFTLNTLADQNGQLNNFSASGAARPTLQVTTPVVVSGAGTAAANGTYSYRGQFNSLPYYNLLGQPDSTSQYVVGDLGDGDPGTFSLYGLVPLYATSNASLSFPWAGTWVATGGDGPSPTVTAGTGQGFIQGSATTGMAGAADLSPGILAGTIYFDIDVANLIDTGTIFETGTFASASARRNQISLRQEANQLVFRIYDASDGTIINSKTVTLANTNRIFGCAQWDTNQVTAANQTSLFVNNSNSGVTSPASNDVFEQSMGTQPPSFFARDAGGTLSAGFTGRLYSNIEALSVADNSAARLAQYNWNQAIKAAYVGPS